MRKLMAVTGGFALLGILSMSSVAGAAPALAAGKHIRPGGVWTITASRGGCTVDTFAGHTFTGDNGDAGYYTGGGSTLAMRRTAGPDNGFTSSADWSKAYYSGAFNDGETGIVVQGADPDC
jgi:hypothetical protein